MKTLPVVAVVAVLPLLSWAQQGGCNITILKRHYIFRCISVCYININITWYIMGLNIAIWMCSYFFIAINIAILMCSYFFIATNIAFYI